MRCLFSPTALCLLALCTATFQGHTSGSREEIADALVSYAAISNTQLPPLTEDDWDDLRRGRPAVGFFKESLVEDDVSAMGVMGVHVVVAPRLLVWLTVMGGTGERDERLTRTYLSRTDDGDYMRYQHIDVPWPFRNRHWVIDCKKNRAVAERSQGRIWEHQWNLADDGLSYLDEAAKLTGLTRKSMDKSIYITSNAGAWILMELDAQRTLVVFWSDVDLGGRIPRSLVRRFARGQIKDRLQDLGPMSQRVARAYAGNPVIHDGFGTPISSAVTLQVAQTDSAIEQPALRGE